MRLGLHILWRCITTILYLSIIIVGTICGLATLPWGLLAFFFIVPLWMRMKDDIKETSKKIKTAKENKSKKNEVEFKQPQHSFTNEEISSLFEWGQKSDTEWTCKYLGLGVANELNIFYSSIYPCYAPYIFDEGIYKQISLANTILKYGGFTTGTMVVQNHIGDITIHYANGTQYRLSLPKEGYALAEIVSQFEPNAIIARIDYSEDKIKEFKKNIQEKIIELELEQARFKEEQEKQEIARKLKERQRRRNLEREVEQELIDRGELFGEQNVRPHIPRDVVDAIWRRDGGRCVYCGSTENLHLDHIIPFSKGGDTSIENLQILCRSCNLKKSNKIG